MKKIAWVLILLMVIVGTFVTSVLPDQFHKLVHKGIVPGIGEGSNITYDENEEKSVIDGTEHILTITSVTELNPLEYHAEIQYRPKSSKTFVTFRVYPVITLKEVGLQVKFEDVNSSQKNGKFQTRNAHLDFTTPITKELLQHGKQMQYLLTNAKIKIAIDEIKFTGKNPPNPSQVNSGSINDFEAFIALNSGTSNNLVITNNLSFKEFTAIMDGKKMGNSDFHLKLELNSINKAGIVEGYRKLSANEKSGVEMPFMFKLMALMGDMKNFVNFPFQIQMDSGAQTSDGDVQADLKVAMNEFKPENMNDFLKAEANGTLPEGIMEEIAVSALMKLTMKSLGKMFYLADVTHPSLAQSMQEHQTLVKIHESKLNLAMREILLDKTAGESKAKLFLADMVKEKFLAREGNMYKLNLTSSGLSLNLGGKPIQTLLPLAMKVDVTQELIAKGFVTSGLDASLNDTSRTPASHETK